MSNILLVIHSLIVIMIISLVLLQRSEGGVLGMSSGGISGLMTGRGQRNALTRATAILAGLFFATSLGISIVTGWEQKNLENPMPEVIEQSSPTPAEQIPLVSPPSKTSRPLSKNDKEIFPLQGSLSPDKTASFPTPQTP